MGNMLITVGVVLVIAGLAYKAGLLNWLGNLPGDLRLGDENRRVYIPITTMIVLSIALSLLLSLWRR